MPELLKIVRLDYVLFVVCHFYINKLLKIQRGCGFADQELVGCLWGAVSVERSRGQ